MICFLQEKADATPTSTPIRCPLQCQVSIDPQNGKVTFADPALRYGLFAKPFPIQQGWTEEFIESIFSLEKDKSLEFYVSDGLIYPVRPRRWVFPAKTMVRENVYPLASARTFSITAIEDQYYAKKELEHARKRAIAVAQGAVTGYSACYVAPTKAEV